VPDHDGLVDVEGVEHGGELSAVIFRGEVRAVSSV
jgi:hypothetical protein